MAPAEDQHTFATVDSCPGPPGLKRTTVSVPPGLEWAAGRPALVQAGYKGSSNVALATRGLAADVPAAGWCFIQERPAVQPNDAPVKVHLQVSDDGSSFGSGLSIVGHTTLDVAAPTEWQQPALADPEVWNQTLWWGQEGLIPHSPSETTRTGPAPANGYTCRWHKSAKTVGVVSEDGHIFTKTAGGQKVIMGNRGVPVEVSSICMVFDESLRCGGVHQYNYQVLNGQLGAADGAGFVFDSQVRRNNIQRMRSVFLNQRGCICLRNCERVEKLSRCLPPLSVGMWLTMQIDLDNLYLRFGVFCSEGNLLGVSDLSLDGLVDSGPGWSKPHSGFFCAVVTKDISVALA